MRGVAAEPGRQSVRPGPAVGAADSGGMPDRDCAGVDLLAVILGQAGRQHDPYLLECAPQPAGAAVGLTLMRQHGEQVTPVAGHLGEEPGLATPAQQMAHHGDGQQFGVAAGWRWTRPGRNGDSSRLDGVIDQRVDVDEQILGWQHECGLCGTGTSTIACLSQRPSHDQGDTL